MNEDIDKVEIKSRNDVWAEQAPKPSLPPTQKLAKDVWGDVFLLLLVGMALLGDKWGALDKGDFSKVLFIVLAIKATLSTGKGINLEALPFLRK